MNKTMKILTALLITIITITILSTVFAAATTTFNPSNVVPNTNNTASVQSLGFRIVGIIQVVGTISSVAILIVLGIKYMMGSAEEKAEYKKTLFPYIIGAVFIFAASNIAKFVYDWAIGL